MKYISVDDLEQAVIVRVKNAQIEHFVQLFQSPLHQELQIMLSSSDWKKYDALAAKISQLGIY